MEVSIAIGFLLLGMLFGSFYHVVGYRMSKGESFVFPPSHCPNCNHKLGPLELIPVLSFCYKRENVKNAKLKYLGFIQSLNYCVEYYLCFVIYHLD